MRAAPDVPREHADRMRSLAVALDAGRMKEVLAPLARERFGGSFDARAIEIEVFRRHYNRYVIRYRVTGAAGAPEWTLIGKVLEGDAGERLHGTMHRLWTNGFARDAADGIAIPEPLAWFPELSMQVQEWVGGASVRDLLKGTRDAAHFRLAARALAKLHRSDLANGPARRVADLLERCHPRHPELARHCPDLAPSAMRALEATLGAVADVTVHGDFHLGQVHVDGDRAWLVDLDAVGRADPASDIGNLLVFLEDKARRHPAIVPLIAAFLDEYFAGVDRGLEARLPLHRGLTHLRRACKTLRLQRPGWRERVERMLDAGVACIASMERRAA